MHSPGIVLVLNSLTSRRYYHTKSENPWHKYQILCQLIELSYSGLPFINFDLYYSSCAYTTGTMAAINMQMTSSNEKDLSF